MSIFLPLNAADYDSIAVAVMETARGRWFLAEYARRNRHAETEPLLAALARIEAAIGEQRSTLSSDRLRFDLVEMAQAIARTKAEIAAIKPDIKHHGKFGEASEALTSIIQDTETATSNILASAEQLQELVWTLRGQAFEPRVCRAIESKITDILIACSFQDLTGQRSRKVIQVLNYLERRINAMIRIWGIDGDGALDAADVEMEPSLADAPALFGDEGLDQQSVDRMLIPEDVPLASAAEPPVRSKAAHPLSVPETVKRDPLERINALSDAEKIALFS
jgi:chemotaxis regulatin CheY-phosphate phosphatase CheZ